MILYVTYFTLIFCFYEEYLIWKYQYIIDKCFERV